MKQKANQSLNNLATLNNQSQTLITQATNLTDSLAVLKQNVSATRETSQQALLIIQDKQQVFTLLFFQSVVSSCLSLFF